MSNLSDILSNSNKDIDNQKLMDYLSGKLSAEDRHEMEKEMLESEMLSEAMEGLESFQNKNQVSLLTEQLNRNLQKQLQKKNRRKGKRKLIDLGWVYLTIALILIVAVIALIVISKHLSWL